MKIPDSPQSLMKFQFIMFSIVSSIFLRIQVAETEGASLAASHGTGFCEVSVADNTPNLYKAFERLLNDSKGRPVKQRKFSVSKMIGNYRLTFNNWKRECIENDWKAWKKTNRIPFIVFDVCRL